MAAQQGDPILELGCGTGRVLLALAQAGHRIIGLDRDPEMLGFLRANLTEELSRRASLFRAEMAAFCLALRFRLILLPCNTFSLLSPSARRSTLERVRHHLQTGGKFAASVPNPVLLHKVHRYSDPEVEDTFPHPMDGEPVQVSSAWKRTSRYFHLTWIYDHLLPDGQVERLTVQARHTLEGVETYRVDFDQAGLQVIHLLGDFDGSPYDRESPNLIFIARKNEQP